MRAGEPSLADYASGMRILLVEDDRAISDAIRTGLAQEGFDVECVATVAAARAALRNRTPDLVVLDLKLPGESGMDLLRSLRNSTNYLPVVIMSALHEVGTRVLGLNAGADDYLTKPFQFEELVARLRAVLRRHRMTATAARLACGSLVVDSEGRTAAIGDSAIELTGKEFDLLELLCANVGRVLTREVLVSRLWGYDWVADANAVDVLVSKVRRRLGDEGRRLIHTVRGVGYVMRLPAGSSVAC